MITEEITGDYDRFSIPIDYISEDVLYEVASRRNLNSRNLPEGTTVQYWELESALEKIDDRKDHKRALDAAISKSVDLKDDRAYDVVLTEVDYDLMDLKDERRNDRWYQGEIDLMMIDTDQKLVRAIEVKPHKGCPRDEKGDPILTAPTQEEKAEKQHERQSYVFDLLNEELEEFDMHYIPEPPVYESELLPGDEIPDIWEGRYRGKEEAMEAMEESEEFRTFMEELVLDENPEIFSRENRLTREKVGLDDFVREYLEDQV